VLWNSLQFHLNWVFTWVYTSRGDDAEVVEYPELYLRHISGDGHNGESVAT
jgi:hypothetical protein